jgi:2-methylcitrate dehydratase PrpD
MSYTSALAEYTAGTRYEDLPDPVVAAAKQVTLDALGVATGAVRSNPATIVAEYIAQLGGQEQASILGTSLRTNTINAAFVNGVMAGDLELDDVHSAGTHPSCVYVPALLALAEHHNATGQEWINALVAAYDIGIRLGVAMDMVQTYAHGFQPTPVCGAVASAAAGARMLGQDAERIAWAIGLAGCQASGLMTWTAESEHFTKSFQVGVGARNGVAAAELVARGYRSTPDTLDNPEYNLMKAFTTSRDYESLTKDLGSRYEILYTSFKFYSCCLAIHTTLDIVFDLMREHRFAAADFDRMDVWLPPELRPMVDGRVLSTHNLQHAAAAAMTDGVVTRVQTSDQRRGDPALAALASRITLFDDDGLLGRHPEAGLRGPTRVDLRLKDGRRFEVERACARGNPTNPVTDADLEAKFLRLAVPVIGNDRANEVVARVQRLEMQGSMREIIGLLSA